MTPEIISLNRHREEEFAPASASPLSSMDFAPDFEAPHNLLAHMRQLRRRSQDAGRWLALAVVADAITAVAFVDFFAR